MYRLTTYLLLSVLSLTTASAQILSTGTGTLPACANSCTTLNQAVQACSGVQSSNTGTWVCFCQSGYLPLLKTKATGDCPDTCTAPADQQALLTWFTGNCGSDFGASEHANDVAGQTMTTPGTPTTTSAGGSTQTSSSGSSGSSSGTTDVTDGQPAYKGSWISSHYQWIIMVFVIGIGLGLFAWLMIWLKKRNERRLDKPAGGFNEGITMHSTLSNRPSAPLSMPMDLSGRDSPVRTRDAFMPYGYGYSRSESRHGSRTNINETPIAKGSPLAHGTTIAELEKTADDRRGKRVQVRERRIEDPEKHFF